MASSCSKLHALCQYNFLCFCSDLYRILCLCPTFLPGYACQLLIKTLQKSKKLVSQPNSWESVRRAFIILVFTSKVSPMSVIEYLLLHGLQCIISTKICTLNLHYANVLRHTEIHTSIIQQLGHCLATLNCFLSPRSGHCKPRCQTLTEKLENTGCQIQYFEADFL